MLPIQILQVRSARSDLPMSNAARKQLGIQPEVIRNIDKHEVLSTHDLHIGQSVMYQNSEIKQWHPAVITSLCQEKRSYMLATSDGVVYRKMQAHFKPYAPQVQEVTIYPVCVTADGTIRPYVASETI